MPAWAQTKRGLIQTHLRWGKTTRRQQETAKTETRAKPEETGVIHPLDGVKANVTLGEKEYPVMVRRVVTDPDGQARAEATYYDDKTGAWQTVEDDMARARLAEQIQAGQIEPWDRMEEGVRPQAGLAQLK